MRKGDLVRVRVGMDAYSDKYCYWVKKGWTTLGYDRRAADHILEHAPDACQILAPVPLNPSSRVAKVLQLPKEFLCR